VKGLPPVNFTKIPVAVGEGVGQYVKIQTGSGIAATIAQHFAEKGAEDLLGRVGAIPTNIGQTPGLKVPTGGDDKLVSNEGGINMISGRCGGATMNHDNIRVIKFSEIYRDGKKSAQLKLAKKLYGSTTVNYYSTLKSVVNRLYAYSGLNSKGIVWPYDSLAVAPSYSTIDTMSDTQLNGSMSIFGESLADEALMLKKSLLGNIGTEAVLTDMPPLGAGDIDYYYPVQSFKNVLSITNTNTYMAVKLKIYVLQARRDTAYGPQELWFGRTAGGTSRMNYNYVTTQKQEPIAGLGPDPYTEVTIHPQAYPGLSESFKEAYKILSVRTFVLKASDMLEFTLEHHFAQALSAGLYNGRKSSGYARVAGHLDLMIEFQGMPTPYAKTGATANTIAYSAMAACGFSKIRYTVDKYFTHSFPISNGLGLYNPTSSQYTPSFVGTSQRPLVSYAETARYWDQFTANPAALNMFIIPLISESIKTYAQPLLNDPV